MDVDLAQASVVVRRHQSLQVRCTPGTQILVLWGCVWITQEGDPRDYVVSSGETMTVHNTGLTLTTALDDSTVSILEPRQEALPRIKRDYPRQDNVRLHMVRANELRNAYVAHLVGRLERSVRLGIAALRGRIRLGLHHIGSGGLHEWSRKMFRHHDNWTKHNRITETVR